MDGVGIVSEMHYLACNMCGDIKCELNDLINLSVEANGTHFVNPSGFVHDLFTVNRIENVIMRGMASTEFSWFPGYAWKTFECNNCSSHLGWQFTSRKLLPKKFYGITRKSIKLSKREDIYSP
uniref:Protein yippee-like n=1 Tax=Ditylenchus dipsaci TaxID=166011 RepID=A0A915E7R1_9BILA